MGIDLEQPSEQYIKENNRPNVNVNMAAGGDGASIKVGNAVVNSSDFSGNINKNIEHVSGGILEKRDKECGGIGINLNSVKALEPHDGIEFESKEEAFSFYKEYAKSVGFSTIIKASRRSRISGKFIDAKFVCTRYGTKHDLSTAEVPQPVLNADGTTSMPVKRKRGRVNQSWSKTDCKACLHVKRRLQDGRWIVRSFIKEHNHEVFPEQAYFSRGHGNLDFSNNNNSDAIRAITKKMYVSLSRQAGGCKKRENQKVSAATQSGSTQNLKLDEGDTQVMLDYFMSMQDENPNFFYAIDLNEEQCLRNVFWVDAKGRLDYAHFSDVVFFDTTYIKNEYRLPFVPFIGVNHHFQFLLLGCALVADETVLTYTWVMRAWLKAMGDRAPKVILTDQDQALTKAIEEAFPGSSHCFCLWHIVSKIPEKLSYVIRQHNNFMTKFNKSIFKSWTIVQFEKRWWKMVERFSLRNDVWFQSLYEDRKRWIPTCMSGKFLAGMSTTQRSDSISCFFDKYIQRKTTLKELLEQHKSILQEKFEEEAKADFETWHKQPFLKSPSPFGKQMATLYTHAIFKKFQFEVLGVVACHPRKESEDGETTTFKVQDFEENQYFIVLYNESTTAASCSCHLFEFNGFLCRHVLIVMQMSGVHSIPSQYILKRWTKDAKSRQTIKEQAGAVESRVQRYVNLCQRAFKLGDEGSMSQESYSIAINALEEVLRKCESLNNPIQSLLEPISASPNVPCDYGDSNASKANKKNAVSRKRQVHPEPEIITIGMHDSWQQMEQINPRASALDGCFGSQHIVQGMGQLSSIPATRDDYYTQQSIHGMGQLNSIAPIHEGQFMTQQRMQGMGQLHFRSQIMPGCFDLQDSLQQMDQSGAGPSQLHGMASKHMHAKHLPR